MASASTGGKASEIETNHTLTAILSYLGILVLIPFFITQGKRDEFIRFHLQQGWTLFIVWIIVWVASIILGAVLGMMGLVGLGLALIVSFIFTILYLLLLVLAIIAIVNGVQGKTWKIPVIGNWVIVKC
ncbi:hypothetical protein HZB88_03560 [archaeon]|nr:hypothetical protein [archaeon]